jgi:hypothetical protein
MLEGAGLGGTVRELLPLAAYCAVVVLAVRLRPWRWVSRWLER